MKPLTRKELDMAPRWATHYKRYYTMDSGWIIGFHNEFKCRFTKFGVLRSKVYRQEMPLDAIKINRGK